MDMPKIILPPDEKLLTPAIYLLVCIYLRALPYSQRAVLDYFSFLLLEFKGEILNSDGTPYLWDVDAVLYDRYICNLRQVGPDGVSPKFKPRKADAIKLLFACYLIDRNKTKTQRY